MKQYNVSCCLFLTLREQHRLRMDISHTVCLTVLSEVHILMTLASALLFYLLYVSMGRQILGCYNQNGLRKFVHLSVGIEPFVSRLLFHNHCSRHKLIYRYRCGSKLVHYYSDCRIIPVLCEIKSVLLECSVI